MSKETVRVTACPLCRGVHTYALEVERAIVLSVHTRRKKSEPPSAVKITSRFTCPVHDRHYDASFHLQDTSADRIRAVSVVGLVRKP